MKQHQLDSMHEPLRVELTGRTEDTMKNLTLKVTLFGLAVALACAGCKSQAEKACESTGPQEMLDERSVLNQPPKGFVALFNGRDLTGWQQIGGRKGSWKVRDGILYAEGDSKGWLSTARQYDNFQLELEFRVPVGGNSGVFVRIPREDGGRPGYEGTEIQILDDYAQKYVGLQPSQYTGSIYGVQAPAKLVSKKANEWQKMAILCNGPQVQVALNGALIVDANLKTHMDKFETHPGLKRPKGYIGLQHHNTRIEYRNIRIKELN